MVLRFTNEIINWVKTGVESLELHSSFNNLTLPTSLQRSDWHSFTGERSIATCIICRSVLDAFMEFHKKGMSANDIKSNVIKLCTRLNFGTERVCNGSVTLNLVSVNSITYI